MAPAPRRWDTAPRRRARRSRRSRSARRRARLPARPPRELRHRRAARRAGRSGSRAFQRSSSPSARYFAGVGAGVAAVAVGLGLDQRRALAGARARDRGGDGLVDRADVLAVDDDAGHRVRLRALGEIVERRRLAQRAVLAVEVVLDHEDDGGLPHRRHVQRLVERADVRRAVAAEREGDARRVPGSSPTARRRRRPGGRRR